MKHLLNLVLFTISSISMDLSGTEIMTAMKMQKMILDSNANAITMNIADDCIVRLKWQERKSSFSQKEGIRTFAGYYENSLRGIISINKNIISGWVSDGYKIYNIDTDTTGNLKCEQRIEQYNTECSIAHDDCSTLTTSDISFKSLKDTQWTEQRNEPLVYNNGILYIYRIALPVSYYNYSTTFYGDISRVKSYWATKQAELNELYVRDIGIYFEIVDDERLIITDPTYRYPSSTISEAIIEESTVNVNKLIGEENYDIGCVIAKSNDVNGQAGLSGAYYKNLKCYCMTTVTAMSTIGHEIGHMFGAYHTFSYGGVSTLYTEPGTGQSIMSYGFPRDFFSIPSIFYIRKYINKLPYLSYPERTDTIGIDNLQGYNYNNFVAGIDTHNNPPEINTNKLKKTYRIPKGTYFQFHIDATDPDGDDLSYMAHQADLHRSTGATFRCNKFQSDPTIRYQPTYSYSWGNQKFIIDDYSEIDNDKTGSYYFWLAATDGKTVTDGEEFLSNPHAMCYDAFETCLEVVDGAPFKITSTIPNRSTCGDRLNLTWTVDKNVFDENSRVRILLSDDFGETFKYVLKESVPNNGNCEVILPHITIGTVKIEEDVNKSVRGGVIKIEEIDGIAYALSAVYPFEEYNDEQYMTGGFLLYASSIVFQNTPERYLTVNSEAEVPEVANVTATYNGRTIDVTFTETRDKNVISRIWEAQTSTGVKSAYEQIICIETTTSDISDIESDHPTVRIHSTSGTLHIEGKTGMDIKIYDTMGRCMFDKNNSSGIESISLRSGIYIIMINGKPYKSIV